MKPIVFDLFCGLGGWSEAFITEGYQAIGFDIEAHDYGSGDYPGTLVVKDIRSINGAVIVAAYGIPACIVASPPCQEFSYMAMPWSKAKAKMAKILADPAEQVRLKELFNECFRIQCEVSEAAGHYIPMVVENVRGAQRWVGKARWNFGSFYLWGDVPALMPIPSKINPGLKLPAGNTTSPMWSERPIQRLCDAGVKAGDRNKAASTGGHRWPTDWSNKERSEGHKTAGMNWSDQTKRGQDFTRIAGNQSGLKMPSENGRHTDVGTGARFTTDCDGSKGFKDFHNGIPCQFGSKSAKRKQASAEIAKIPRPLAQWIARIFKPQHATK